MPEAIARYGNNTVELLKLWLAFSELSPCYDDVGEFEKLLQEHASVVKKYTFDVMRATLHFPLEWKLKLRECVAGGSRLDKSLFHRWFWPSFDFRIMKYLDDDSVNNVFAASKTSFNNLYEQRPGVSTTHQVFSKLYDNAINIIDDQRVSCGGICPPIFLLPRYLSNLVVGGSCSNRVFRYLLSIAVIYLVVCEYQNVGVVQSFKEPTGQQLKMMNLAAHELSCRVNVVNGACSDGVFVNNMIDWVRKYGGDIANYSQSLQGTPVVSSLGFGLIKATLAILSLCFINFHTYETGYKSNSFCAFTNSLLFVASYGAMIGLVPIFFKDWSDSAYKIMMPLLCWHNDLAQAQGADYVDPGSVCYYEGLVGFKPAVLNNPAQLECADDLCECPCVLSSDNLAPDIAGLTGLVHARLSSLGGCGSVVMILWPVFLVIPPVVSFIMTICHFFDSDTLLYDKENKLRKSLDKMNMIIPGFIKEYVRLQSFSEIYLDAYENCAGRFLTQWL